MKRMLALVLLCVDLVMLTACSSNDKCGMCGGTGYYEKKTCPACNGTGKSDYDPYDRYNKLINN